MLLELSPLDPRFELMIGTMYGLANAGRTNAKGMPSLLQLAMIGREFQDVIQFAKPPHAVQQVMFGLLGPLGRMRSYRGSIASILTPTAAPPQIQRCLRSPGWHHRIRVLPAMRPGRVAASLRSGRYQQAGGTGCGRTQIVRCWAPRSPSLARPRWAAWWRSAISFPVSRSG